MRVFITGATDVFGKKVVKLLVDKGIEVSALCRSESNEKIIRSLRGIPVTGDLFKIIDMIAVSISCDAILHLATAIPKKDGPSLKDWQLNDRIRVEAKLYSFYGWRKIDYNQYDMKVSFLRQI